MPLVLTRRIQPLHGLLDLAPVVSVVLLLLCFFLLSSSFVLQPGIKVDPPRSVVGVGTPASRLIVAVTLGAAQGSIDLYEQAHVTEASASQVAIVYKFQQLDVGVIEYGQQLAFRLKVEIENLGLGNFRVVKDPHDNAYQFFDVLHHLSSRPTDEQVHIMAK